MIRSGTAILLLLIPVFLSGQDTAASSSGVQKILRIHYRNDFYTQTDYYFTQGEHVEYIHPAFGTFFLNKILPGTGKWNHSQNGLSFHGGGYTPTRLDTAGPLRNDRPFAAYLFFGFFRETTSPGKKLGMKSEFALGFIGPPALGKETQVFLHRTFGSSSPLGWDNQVRTDIVFQYSVKLEKILFQIHKFPLLGWEGEATAGTLRSFVSSGFTIGGESLPAFFENRDVKFFLTPFAGGKIALIGYDALMQGGLFNRSSPHVFSAEKIERWVYYGNAGIKAGYKKFKLGFSIEFISPEFKEGLSHKWGVMEAALRF